MASERLQAIRKEMAELDRLRLSDRAAAERFSALAIEGAAIVNATAKDVAKRLKLKPRTISAGHFEKTFRIGLR